MDLLRVGFTLIWGLLTLFLSLFVLWRKLRQERVDFEDLVVDRAFLGLIGGLMGGRLVYILLHFASFGTDLFKWLSLTSMSGIVDIFSLIFGILIFWLMLGKEWKDPVEILDYSTIGLTFFLFLLTLGDVIFQGINYAGLKVLAPTAILPPFDFKILIASSLLACLYFGLYLFLSWVEKNYRTFLWYRSKRRSAQTGFVFASFLIAYGLFGVTLGWLLPDMIVLAGLGVDPIFKLLVMLAGLVLLYVRSGRRS